MKVYGLVGFPLSHSFSAEYFAGKFKRERITDCRYTLFPIETIDQLPDLIRSEPELAGLNVTIPYKQSVISYLNQLDSGAEQIGAVNTIKINRNKDFYTLMGFNTDAYGFMESLRPLINQNHQQALILGTGGASRSVAYILRQLGIRMTFVSRNPILPGHISYKDISPSIIAMCKIIINTSPLGMFPNIASYPPIPYESLTKEHLLYDLVYNPVTTEFLKRGEYKGAKTINGLQMLHLQADKAWEIWNSGKF